MLSEQAKQFIFERNKEYEARKNTPPAPLDFAAIRKMEYEFALSQKSAYSNTTVTTEDFFGTPVDVMVPKTIKSEDVYFYLHGGAWAFGSAMNARLTACFFTEEIGAVALCPDYRLAPEHKYSVLLSDCLNAYKKAVEKYGAKRLIVGGSSAGGNLCLALLQKAKEEGVPLPKGIYLLSPVVKILPEGGKELLQKDDIILRTYRESEVALYGDEPNDYQNKYFSPIYGDYEGFPPTYICCGSEEMLLGDGIELFYKMRSSGVKAVLSVRAGMWHSYPECQRFVPEGKEELFKAVSYLQERTKTE